MAGRGAADAGRAVGLAGRALLVMMAALGALLAAAAPAAAHDVGGVGATDFRTTLSGLSPAVSGVSLRVIENGSRLELRNDTGAEVVVAGYSGEPYARVGPDGAFVNRFSPATYLNADRFSVTAVPATADPRRPPVWDRVGSEPVLRWHDHRTHWMLSTLPPMVAADPRAEHHIASWTVHLTYAGTPLTATGSLDWVPGPSPWPWFVAMAVLVAGLAVAAHRTRPHRVLAVATLAVVAGQLIHGIGTSSAIVGTVPQHLGAVLGSDVILIWPLALLSAWLLWRGHTRAIWLAAGSGLFTAVSLILDDAPLWWRSSAPSGLPPVLNRAVLALAVGAGLGLAAALVPTLRRHAPPPRPWPSPTTAAAGGPGRSPTGDPALPPAARVAGSAAEAPQLTGSVPTGDDAPAAPSPHPTTGDLPVPAPRPMVRTGIMRAPRAVAGPGGAAARAPRPMPAAGHDGGDPPGEDVVPAGMGRRQLGGYLVAGALGALAGAATGSTLTPRPAAPAPGAATGPALHDVGSRTIAFHGPRQAGIARPVRPQAHVWVAGLDLLPTADRTELGALLARWTRAAAALTTATPLGDSDDAVVAGLGPAALTITVGFGPSLFGRAGVPVSARPAALAPLPAFPGERLDRAASDGDLGLVIAADDALVVAHAARTLSRLANGAARVRWQLTGFGAARGSGAETATSRNLMGQLDGSNNPKPADPDFDARVFVNDQDPAVWMRGGSYVVIRRIRMLLDEWDHYGRSQQEAVIGRRRDTGAPLTGGTEFTPADYGARGADGELVIAENAHIRLATPALNNGAAMLRRGFSYVDGAASGLIFMAWQADPRHGFVPVQQRLVAGDALGRFIRHETSALFAAPGGVDPGEYVGQRLVQP